METVWIIGSGKFGLRAAKWLLGQENFNLMVVDQDKDSLVRARALGCRVENGNGVDFLAEQLKPGIGPDWIVPAVPVHLAWEWLCRKGRITRTAVPGPASDVLPNPMSGASGDLYVSHANFLCPPNCDEPDECCTYTGQPRKPAMYGLISGLLLDGFDTLVLQSIQLGPGVGGYRPGALFGLLDRVAQIKPGIRPGVGPGEGAGLLVATACRCHGVISAGRVAAGG